VDHRPPDRTFGQGGQAAGGWPLRAQTLLMLVYLVGMLDRSIVTVLLQPIKQEFHLTDTQLGFISGMAFSLSYGLAAVPMGMLADRFSRRNMLALLVLIWSSLTFASGLVSGFLLLCVARLGVGFAEAGQPPMVMSLVGDIFAPRRRATAISLIYLGLPVGALCGYLVAGKIAAVYGWRVAIMGAGTPGIVLAIAIVLFLREPARGGLDGRLASTSAGIGFAEGVRHLLGNRALMHTLAAAGLASVIASAMSVWLPSLIMRRFDVGIGVAGPALAVSMGVFGIVGALLGGPIADWIGRGSLSRMASVTAGMILALLPLSLICFAAPSMTISVIFNGLFNLLLPGYLSGLHALVIGMTVPRARGFVISLLAVMLTLFGYGLGSQFIGMLSDVFAARGYANSLLLALLVSTVTIVWAVAHLLRARSLLISRGPAAIVAAAVA